MQFIQCDDFVEAAIADEIEQTMLSNRFPWYFYANVNYGAKPPAERMEIFRDDPRFADSFGFSGLIYPTQDPNSPWFAHSKHVLESFLNRHNIRPSQLVRIKANLLVRSAAPDGPKPFTPHVDLPKPHWAMIYYVNDSDGDTLILDKTHPNWENAVVIKSVSPKKGRAILFDGRHYHCGTSPARHDTRVVINFNFV